MIHFMQMDEINWKTSWQMNRKKTASACATRSTVFPSVETGGVRLCIHWESICSQQKHTASHQHWTCLYDPCVWHQGEPHTFSMKWESEWCLSEKVNYWILSAKVTKRSREQRRHLRLTATVTTLGVNLQPHNLQGHFSIAEERNSGGGGD